MVRGSPGPMLESLLPLCWSNCCVVPFAMADAPPRFFVDPGGCRRERVAPKRPAPRDLRPVVHSAYEDENKQGLGYNEHDPRHGLRLGRVLVGGVVNTSRSERGDGNISRPERACARVCVSALYFYVRLLLVTPVFELSMTSPVQPTAVLISQLPCKGANRV